MEGGELTTGHVAKHLPYKFYSFKKGVYAKVDNLGNPSGNVFGEINTGGFFESGHIYILH